MAIDQYLVFYFFFSVGLAIYVIYSKKNELYHKHFIFLIINQFSKNAPVNIIFLEHIKCSSG